jgi:hypothetical protein
MSAVALQDLNGSVNIQYNNHFAYKMLGTMFGNGTYCDNTYIQQNLTLTLAPDNITCIVGCMTPNEVVGVTEVYCQAFSVIENWSYGYNTFTYFAPKSSNYQITYAKSAWGPLAAVGTGAIGTANSASWQMTLTQNLENRKDTNTINSTPVTQIAPFISIPQGIIYTLRIPTMDADGDVIKCKFYQSKEKKLYNFKN